MKPAKYTMSDSESDVEGIHIDNDDFIFNAEPVNFMSTDNDDFIFNAEPVNFMSTDDDQGFRNNMLSPVRRKAEKLKKNSKTSKNTEKKAKKLKLEVVKQPKPTELIKSLTVVIDSSLLNHTFGSELLAALRSADIRYNVQEQKLPSTITWTLENDQSSQKFFENYIIFLWTWKDLVDLIAERKLYTEVESKMKSLPNSKLTLIIFGMEEYFRKSKTWKNRETVANSTNNEKNPKKINKREKTAILSKMDIEFAVGELQLLNLQYRFFETGDDLGLYIAQFTKALTELPQKLERNKRLECTDWYATGDSKESIRVDAAGNGLTSLWQQQICQFPNVTLDIAQAIVSNYSSPLALINAYDSCSSRKEAELLLQNIPIRRVHGPLTSVRKVGPELSKKIHQFFCGEDGNLFIS